MGACYHIEGVRCDNCRINYWPQRLIVADPAPTVTRIDGEPVKCPECGVWWRGIEHRCGDLTTTISTANTQSTTDVTIS